ncbi:hypothetical protein ZIOFF_022352 [Zingiber officinale]|uniref:Deoxyuridine 5'-triphosphate nucleotidohydrolase n=1 Tax=Zingiber officinale TaxID=94328 RepID=A0A8J5HLB7_ZINOF|nr:hypothetical protein ZIOFF_022352 [Zingiber officinale]
MSPWFPVLYLVSELVQRDDNAYVDEYFEEYEQSPQPDAHPFILVHKLSPYAILPQQKSAGAARFDLAASQPCTIEPKGQGKVSTCLIMEIPWGSYGRIATRSRAAWKLGIDVGVGVIDCDYRGEIIILVFNHSNTPVTIRQGDCIAQIIFENILMPDIYEVPDFTTTTRGKGGFRSTSQTPAIFSKLLPKEKHAVSVLVEDTLPQENLVEVHAGTTSPGVFVLRSMDTSLETFEEEDNLLDQISYMTSITHPMEKVDQLIWDYSDTESDMEADWVNPFATEETTQSSQLIATGYEIEYPNMRRLVESQPDQ